MDTVVLLAARSYDFKDDAGKTVQGVTLTYLTGDVDAEPTRRGCSPMSVSAPTEIFAQLGPVPGVYGIDFKQRPGKNGRPTLTAVALQFKTALDGLLRPVQSPQGGVQPAR